MNPQLQAAQPQVDAVYNPAIKNIQQQIPAVQQLYSALLQGLQAQTSNQVNNVISSANQRGVGSAGIEQGAQQALQGTMGLQGAQLGAQQAGTIADLSGQIGKAQVGRGQATYDLASSLQKQALEGQSNKQAMTEIDRKAALQQQQNQQQFNVQQASYQRAQAKAAAAAAERAKGAAQDMDLKEFLSKADASFNRMVGGDGKVSPDTWGKALDLWRAKGLPDTEFVNRYKGFVNREHVQDYMNAFKG